MFENIAAKLQDTLYKIKNKGYITEKDLDATLRDIRMTMLEADVNYKIVKDFIKGVKEACIGREVLVGLNPDQIIIKVVYDGLTELLGGKTEKIATSPNPPTVIMMSGLQGAGKTTTTGKLARLIKAEKRKKILLVSADVYRPAAIEQLKLLAEQVGVDFYPSDTTQKAEEIAAAALDYAKKHYYDVLMVDTAGRLAIDEEMMTEIKNLHH